jgi:deoxyribonuclease IV
MTRCIEASFPKGKLLGGMSVYIGSHVSIRNGYSGAAKLAHSIGANAFQYFPKNPRSLATKSFDPRDAEACAKYCEENRILSIGHAPYPLNPAAGEASEAVMLAALINGLEITNACGSVGLVVHFGKYQGKETLQGYKNIIQLLNKALRGWQGKALVLLENQAGEGAQMGLAIEELVQVRSLCDHPDKIGFCLDTCHAFASGLWNGANWLSVQARGEELGYFHQLKAVHLNDSVHPAGARRDRHANIGYGHIGKAGLAQMLASPFVRSIPVVLETETGADGTHREEIALVKELAGAGKQATN